MFDPLLPYTKYLLKPLTYIDQNKAYTDILNKDNETNIIKLASFPKPNLAAEYMTLGLAPPQIGFPTVNMPTANLIDIVISASRTDTALKIIGVEWYGATQAIGSKNLQLQVISNFRIIQDLLEQMSRPSNRTAKIVSF